MTTFPAPAARLLLGLALGLGPGAAWACRPDFHRHETPLRIEGAAGAVTWEHDIYQQTGLGPAQDLGQGFVLQWTLEGNACSGERSAVVQDCTTGEAVAIGGAFDLMDPALFAEEESLVPIIEEHLGAGRPLTVAEIAADAAARGIESIVPMRTDTTFRLGTFEFRLGEACRMHYPGLLGTP